MSTRQILRYRCSDREALAGLWNGWLSKAEMDEAKRLAGVGTDEDCTRYLDTLDRRCVVARGTWEMCR